MRKGVTLLELLIAISLFMLLVTFVSSRVGNRLDKLAVRSAAADVAGAFAVARNAAIARGAYVTVGIDSTRNSVTVFSSGDTLLKRLAGAVHNVRLKSNRDSLAYDPVGHGSGASNQSIVISRGEVAETVVVSRLGRVRFRG